MSEEISKVVKQQISARHILPREDKKKTSPPLLSSLLIESVRQHVMFRDNDINKLVVFVFLSQCVPAPRKLLFGRNSRYTICTFINFTFGLS